MRSKRLEALRDLLQELAIITLITLIIILNMFIYVEARHVAVVQSPITKNLTYYSGPVIGWKGFGEVIEYRRVSQCWFYEEPN